MKIITWNCNGKFREKFKEIIEEDADIYVIQECENPARAKIEEYREFAGDNFFWVGDIHYKGLGIFAKDNVKLEKIDSLNENFKNFIALRVNDSFNLLGVWAMPKYVEMIHDYFDANFELFDENLIMCGDFNSNAIWDKLHGEKNQTNLDKKLNSKGLVSAFHYLAMENQGEESKATFYQSRHLNWPFYIDYVYTKKDLIERFLILDHYKWITLSDHLPISFEINLEDK